jgi:ribosomal protein S27AE
LTSYALTFSKKRRRLKQIKCPLCEHGRLCDVPAESKTKAALLDNHDDTVDSIFIKCPKCGISVALTTEY